MASLLIIASVVLTIGLGIVLARGVITLTLALMGTPAAPVVASTGNEAA